MDKFSKTKLVEATREIVKNAHMGSLNGIEEVDVSVYIGRKKVPMEQNIQVIQAFAHVAALNCAPVTCKVLMYLFSLSEYENYIGIDIKTIAENIRYTERSVLSAMAELYKYNIILKIQHPSDKRRHDYFINPKAAWKGSSANRNKTMKKLVENNPNQLDMFKGKYDILLPPGQSNEDKSTKKDEWLKDAKANTDIKIDFSKKAGDVFDDFKEVNDGEKV